MKNLIKILLTFVSIIAKISCEEENEIPKTGEPFWRASNMKFYFINQSGEDLLSSENNEIRPIKFDFTLDIPEQETYMDSINYFSESSSISYNSEFEKYYWQTPINGKEGYLSHQFYVFISEGDIDTIRAEFRYTTGAYDGGDGIYANIDMLTYNGIIIRSGENTSTEFIPENIFILKENGKTTITFED